MNATLGRPLPTTIPQYLEQLRDALRDARDVDALRGRLFGGPVPTMAVRP